MTCLKSFRPSASWTAKEHTSPPSPVTTQREQAATASGPVDGCRAIMPLSNISNDMVYTSQWLSDAGKSVDETTDGPSAGLELAPPDVDASPLCATPDVDASPLCATPDPANRTYSLAVRPGHGRA